jgi:hypothetical protein
MITHQQQLTRYRAICCPGAQAAPATWFERTEPAPDLVDAPSIPPRVPARHLTGIVREEPPPFHVISEPTPPDSGRIP